MADLICTINKVSSLAKEGVDTSGNNHSLDLTLLTSGTGEHFIARVLSNRQGLTGEGRLVNL